MIGSKSFGVARPAIVDRGPAVFGGLSAALFIFVAFAASQAAELGTPPTLEALSATRDRPIFHPSRRAPALPQAVASASAPSTLVVAEPVAKPSSTLTGIIYGRGNQLAILQEAGTGRSVSIKVGDEIEGWTVAKVLPRRLVLEHDGERHEMKLKEPGEPLE